MSLSLFLRDCGGLGRVLPPGAAEEQVYFLLPGGPSPCPVPPEMTKRDVPGFAIGGLSGGESKGQFWRMVALSTSRLPKDKPRYLMGVGYVEGRGDSPTCGERVPGDSCLRWRWWKDTALPGRGLKEDMAFLWGWFRGNVAQSLGSRSVCVGGDLGV